MSKMCQNSLASSSKYTKESKVENAAFIKREPIHSDPNINSKLLTEDLACDQKDRKASANSRHSAERANKREVLLDTRESLINTREQDLKNPVKLPEEQELLLRQTTMEAELEQLMKDKNGEEIKDEFKRTGSITSMDESDNGRSSSMTSISNREIKHHLLAVQTDMNQLKGNMIGQLEEQRHEMKGLNTRIATLENEKVEAEKIRLAEVSKLKRDLTNIKMFYDQTVNELRKEIECKETQCQEMKAEVESICKNLSGRLYQVEEDKSKTERKLQEHTKEMQSLKQALEQRESEIVNLKRNLQQKVIANNKFSKQVGELKTETFSQQKDKERLEKYIKEREAELVDLKNEVTKLRTDNRKLGQENKQLQGRLGKPDWKHNRNSTFHTK